MELVYPNQSSRVQVGPCVFLKAGSQCLQNIICPFTMEVVEGIWVFVEPYEKFRLVEVKEKKNCAMVICLEICFF